jgi:hypothetical protein
MRNKKNTGKFRGARGIPYDKTPTGRWYSQDADMDGLARCNASIQSSSQHSA